MAVAPRDLSPPKGEPRTPKSGAIATASPSIPRARGPITAGLIEQLCSEQPKPMLPDVGSVSEPLGDDDLQLALYLCYELHYRGLEGVRRIGNGVRVCSSFAPSSRE